MVAMLVAMLVVVVVVVVDNLGRSSPESCQPHCRRTGGGGGGGFEVIVCEELRILIITIIITIASGWTRYIPIITSHILCFCNQQNQQSLGMVLNTTIQRRGIYITWISWIPSIIIIILSPPPKCLTSLSCALLWWWWWW